MTLFVTMLLIVHNLPSHIKYTDLKILIHNKCNIDDVILDKLSKDGDTTNKVTIGVAKEADIIKIMRGLNGTIVEGQKIFVEEVKKNTSEVSTSWKNAGGTSTTKNQATDYMNNLNAWNMQMYQYGYGMMGQSGMMGQPGMMGQTGMNTGYGMQAGNQQAMGMQNYAGYGASNTTGIPSLMQSGNMAYGNLQGQQAQMGTKDSGLTSGSQNQGYNSGSVQKGYGSQQYPKNDVCSQRYQNKQETKSYGSRYNDPKIDSQRDTRIGNQSSGNRNQGGYGNKSWENNSSGGNDDLRGIGDRKRRYSPDRNERHGYGESRGLQSVSGGLEGNQSRGFESNTVRKGLGVSQGALGNQSWGNGAGTNLNRSFDSNSREKGLGNNQNYGLRTESWATGVGGNQSRSFDSDSRGKGLGSNENRGFRTESWGTGVGDNQNRSFDNDSRGKGVGGNQSGGLDDDFRGKGLGGNQSRFDDDTRGGNPNRSFETDRGNSFDRNQAKGYDARDKYNTGGSTRDYQKQPPNPAPMSSKPNDKFFWSKKDANPPYAFYNKPVFTKDNRLDLSQPRKKRPKIDKAERKAQRHISWRGMATTFIAKGIMQRYYQGPYSKQPGKDLLAQVKKAVSSQLEAVLKREFPGDPYPKMRENVMVELYRSVYHPSEDIKLYNSVKDGAPHLEPGNQPVPPKQMGPPESKQGPPEGNTGLHQAGFKKPTQPFKKPTLADLLPPSVRQAQIKPIKPTFKGKNKPEKVLTPIQLEKRAKRERKMLHKTEFLDASLYKCKTPQTEDALNAVLDELIDVYTKAVEEYETTNATEKLIGQEIINKTTTEFRTTVRLHTIKRILNETSTLMLRLFLHGGRAPKTEVERVMAPFGITNIKSSKTSKSPMLMALVDSYEIYDKLCTHPGVPCNGRDGTVYVSAKPLHLTIPMKFRRLLHSKKLQDADDDEVEFVDNAIGDDDDDVIEVDSKEPDVIELSGDENKPEELNTSDAKDNDAEVNDGNANDNDVIIKDDDEKLNENDGGVASTVDLTVNDDNVGNEAVDNKNNEELEEIEEIDDAVNEIDDEEIKEDDLEDY